MFLVLDTTSGQLVNIEINNNARYGYDVRCELVGENGSIDLGAPVYGRVNVELQAVERYPADWRPRFAEAYRIQDKMWVRSIEFGEYPAVAANAWDGYCAAVVAEAGVRSLREGRTVAVDMAKKPALYQ